MTRALTILRKEFTDTIRDKRTILMMVVIPLLVIPALIGVVAKVAKSQAQKAAAEESRIAFIGGENSPALYDRVASDSMFSIRQDVALCYFRESAHVRAGCRCENRCEQETRTLRHPAER